MIDAVNQANGATDASLTFSEAGRIVGANARYIRHAVRNGYLRAELGDDGELRVLRSDLDTFISPTIQVIMRGMHQLFLPPVPLRKPKK